MQQISVSDNAGDRRYEARLDDAVAGFAAYRHDGPTVVFTHTEVDPALEGQGIGSRLVGAALDDVRARGLMVRPLCGFVRSFITDHPVYADLVTG